MESLKRVPYENTLAHMDILNNDIKYISDWLSFCDLSTNDFSVIDTNKSTSWDFIYKYAVGIVYIHLTCRSYLKSLRICIYAGRSSRLLILLGGVSLIIRDHNKIHHYYFSWWFCVFDEVKCWWGWKVEVLGRFM